MTNDERIAMIEQFLSTKTPEQRLAYIRNEQEHDIIVCRKASERLQARIEIIEGDIHHIKVNDEIMGYNEYEAWRINREQELQSQSSPTSHLIGGWFVN